MGTKYIYALGFFDGVHLGHQALLKECCRMAQELDAVPGAITFDNHPKALILNPPPVLLSTEADRRILLERYGIRQIHTFPVVPEVMGQHWERFVEKLLELDAVGFVCGDDFRFGYRGLGNAESLRGYCRDHGLPCVVVPEQTLNGNRISSTLIRRWMEAGDLEAANAYLGHPYLLTAIADCKAGEEGTLLLPTTVAIPKPGAYDCRVTVDGCGYSAVVRLTPAGASIRIQSLEEDLSGRSVTLEFHSPSEEER